VTLHVEQIRMPVPEVLDIPERRYVCVRVEDTGTGIRAADIPYLFDTFFTTKEEGEGTGLGLAVSSRIAREHGGWIEVKTEEGQGACFSVYLPVADAGRSEREQHAAARRPS
jgi:signal transduction histidine kinase